MRGRLSPWPAYVDLFAGLVVILLGAFMNSNQRQTVAEEKNAKYEKDLGLVTKARQQAEQFYTSLEKLRRIGEVEPSRCSEEEVCLNINLEFATNKDELSHVDVSRVRGLGKAIASALDSLFQDNVGQKSVAQIVIEGHTDGIDANLISDERNKFRFNWDLSARRASSVMYELSEAGLSKSVGYNIVAWGRADADPLPCGGSDEQCRQQNRRTTIKIKFDYSKGAGAGSAEAETGQPEGRR